MPGTGTIGVGQAGPGPCFLVSCLGRPIVPVPDGHLYSRFCPTAAAACLLAGRSHSPLLLKVVFTHLVIKVAAGRAHLTEVAVTSVRSSLLDAWSPPLMRRDWQTRDQANQRPQWHNPVTQHCASSREMSGRCAGKEGD